MSRRFTGQAAPRSDAEWIRIIEEWRGSRLGTREFCESRGLSVKTFQWRRWSMEKGKPQQRGRRRLARRQRARKEPNALVKASAVEVPTFVELVDRARPCQPPSRRESGVEVVVTGLGGDHRVRVAVEFDTATLRQVVATLREA